MAVSDAADGAEQQVIENIFRYASLEISKILMAKFDTNLLDNLEHAKELGLFSQAIEMKDRSGSFLERKFWCTYISPRRANRRAHH